MLMLDVLLFRVRFNKYVLYLFVINDGSRVYLIVFRFGFLVVLEVLKVVLVFKLVVKV